ncbi:antitoxin HicB [uncultured Gammaproteobacteria bacterium]
MQEHPRLPHIGAPPDDGCQAREFIAQKRIITPLIIMHIRVIVRLVKPIGMPAIKPDELPRKLKAAFGPGQPDERLVIVPTRVAIKALLWQSVKDRGWCRADLARDLGWTQSQVDRLLDPKHATRYDQVDAALAALGKRLTVDVRDAA